MQTLNYGFYKAARDETGRLGLSKSATRYWVVVIRVNDWYIIKNFVAKPTKRQLRQLRKSTDREQVLTITE